MKAQINYFPLFLLFYFLSLSSGNTNNDYAIVIHGGAGWFSSMPEDEIMGIKKGLKQALDTGYEILDKDGSSIDAVEEAIKMLEDNPLLTQVGVLYITLRVFRNSMLQLCKVVIIMLVLLRE
tara:strand:- start:592 stop:957 length:366 start_codon:yes stop_codon:yes gene_type:complete